MLQLKEEGYSAKDISDVLDRSVVSVSVKLKRLKKKDNTYNQKHLLEKQKTNKYFVDYLKPKSVLDLYHGVGNPAYEGLKTTTNDINPEFDCDYNLDALHCLCNLYYQTKKYDLIDLDPFGSAYDCFDLAIKMAKKGLCITFGELGHKRFKRLDFVKTRYGITELDEFNTENLIKKVQEIGIQNKKKLDVFDVKEWQNISRAWFVIKPYKETSQWEISSKDTITQTKLV